jgi:hypothetical protein
VHSSGGAHLINDWCRSNRSYGFEQASLRLSERAYQSKIAKSTLEPVPPLDEKANNAMIDSQLARALQARVANQPSLLHITSDVQQRE